MIKHIVNLTIVLPILLALLASQPAFAVGHPYEFSADARMAYKSDTPIDKTYGYMTVVTDKKGNGTINVMFSNGNRFNSARFNARVIFLDASGAVISEEYFDHWLAATEFEEAIEGKVTKSLTLSNFDSIEVDFYLSDISSSDSAMANYEDTVKVSNTTGYFDD